MSADTTSGAWHVHVGRSWVGHDLEDACSCGKAPCGLVDSELIDGSCPQHALGAAKTMRQIHGAGACTHTPVHEPDEMGFGYEDETIWLPRSRYPKRADAMKFYAEHTGVRYIEVTALARWAVHDPQPHEPEWWAECPRGTPGAFQVWRCS